MQTSRTSANAANKQPTDNKIIYKELSYKINGLLFKVHDALGRYARKNQYADLFELYLKEENIPYEREKNISKTSVDKNRSDFLIEKSIVLEMKVKTFTNQTDYYQVKRYLEILNLKLGILVNFRQKYLSPKRILNSKV